VTGFVVANIIAVVVMLAIGYSYLISPETVPLVAPLGLGFPIIVVINIGFLGFWVFLGWKKTAISVVGLLLCYPPLRTYVPINFTNEPPLNALKVVTFNSMSFHGSPDTDIPTDRWVVVDYLIELNADIICLQETDLKNMGEGYQAKLYATYPYHMDDNREPNGSSVALLSKYPILSTRQIDYPSEGNLSVAHELRINGDTVVVVNNHLESTHLGTDEREGFRRMVKGSMGKEYVATESKSLLRTLANSSKIRAAQAAAVAKYLEPLKNRKVIVCGDFNDSPISYAHHTIENGLTDCFEEVGNGFGWSYCHNAMRVRIDHIFCSKSFIPRKCIVDSKNALSDHYSVICWLEESRKR